MNNLDQLVKEYKQSKDPKILNNIFILLKSTIKDRAKYIFSHQNFVKEKKIMKVYDPKKKKLVDKEFIIGFKLVETNFMEFRDVIGELNLMILKLIENYDTKFEFSHYLVSAIKRWRPPCIRDEIIKKQFKNVSTIVVDEEGEESNLLENVTIEPDIEIPNLEDLFVNLTDTEKKVIQILNKNPKIKQVELAKEIGVTRNWIGRIMIDLKNKYKNS
jgi:hypothetical protein